MKYFTLEITVDGKPATFKQAAESEEEALAKCIGYFHDPDLPKEIHKNMMILSVTQDAKWEPTFP